MTGLFDNILKWLLSDSGQLLTTGIAAFLTLSIFSFLYKDNPFYKFAERLVAGVATGYWTMLLYWTNFIDKVADPIKLHVGGIISSFSHPYTSVLFSPLHGFFGAFIDALLIVIIPTTLGILMWTRFSRNYSWVSRYSIAFYIGISSGLSIPIALFTGIFKQLQATIVPITFNMAGLNYLLITIAVLSALIYFFFSAAHKGTMGLFSRIGIYVIMIGFGAGFGLTVMGRVALLVQRVIFLKDYVSGLGSSIF
jgi:hypothetical protein